MVSLIKYFQEARSNGSKTIELRLFDKKRRQINISDYIIFTNLSDESRKIAVKVRALYRFATFEDLFAEIPPYMCGSKNDETPKEAAGRMREYYSDEQVHACGVLGIKMELVSLNDVMEKREYEALT